MQRRVCNEETAGQARKKALGNHLDTCCYQTQEEFVAEGKQREETFLTVAATKYKKPEKVPSLLKGESVARKGLPYFCSVKTSEREKAALEKNQSQTHRGMTGRTGKGKKRGGGVPGRGDHKKARKKHTRLRKENHTG